jgi:hypothetical protein
MQIIDKNYIDTTEKNVRQSHIDLSEPCLERGGNSTVHQGVLAQYLNTTMPTDRKRVSLCHACHNGKCSNPKHLYWGNDRENYEDQKENGTVPGVYSHMIEKYGREGYSSLAKKAGSLGGKASQAKISKEERSRRAKLAWQNRKNRS